MEKNSINYEENNKKSCVYVLALGGTVGSVVKNTNDEFYNSPNLDICELLQSLPFDSEKITVISEQFLQKISHELTKVDLLNIAHKITNLVNDKKIEGVVVVQGTNCIEEVAYFINLVVKTNKPLVFTGSHRPQNSLGFDGSRNLYNAVLLASSDKASTLGVILTFNDNIISARYASKFSPSGLESYSANGLGVIGVIQGKNILIQQLPNYKHTYQSEFVISDSFKDQKVYVVYGNLGMDRLFIDTLIQAKIQGIISAGMGKGYQSKTVTDALIEASEQGIIIVRCSRTGQGLVTKEPNFDDKYGFIVGNSLSPQKAQILLSIALCKTQDKNKIQQFFDEY